MQYLDQLNAAQKNAVTHLKGPQMIIAGPGSGKTRVLTFRIAFLIEQNIQPWQILALTFTNKAAKEMRERIFHLIGHDAQALHWMGTFHSVFSRILRVEAHLLGFTPNFTIYDTADSKSLLSAIIKDYLDLDDKIYKVSAVASRISYLKNELITWQDYLESPELIEEDRRARRTEMGKIYKAYTLRAQKANAMDFDDLIINTYLLFKQFPNVLEKYAQKFKQVMVDEFQDTNFAQYQVLKLLTMEHQNLSVVGDDAQSIYAFRGAKIENMLNLRKDFPTLVEHKLEQNYRSTDAIVQNANAVIAHNTKQLNKTIWTQNGAGQPVDLIRLPTDIEEARFVASTIFEAKMAQNLKNTDFLILYRTNAQSRVIEEALRKSHLEYKIIGGLSFYQRKEIKDLVAYLRLAVNQNDEEAFKRVINLPKRGIGETTVNKIIIKAFELNLPLWDVISSPDIYLKGNRSNAALQKFALLMSKIAYNVEQRPAFEVAEQIVNASGLMAELKKDDSIEGTSRVENAQELLNAIKDFTDNHIKTDGGVNTLADFLQEISLLTSNDQDNANEEAITLMTVHMAKGLEFQYVFLVGMEEELFPSIMMLNNREDLEEERRLFYVGITRAKQKLLLTYAMQRYRFGKLVFAEPSRFLQELNPNFTRRNNAFFGSSSSANTSAANRQPQSRVQAVNTSWAQGLKQPPTRIRAIEHQVSANFVASNPRELQVGMKVEHPKFGFGRVCALDLEGQDKRARIEFDQHGVKTLILSFAKLMIIS